jgi:hypothetical protein
MMSSSGRSSVFPQLDKVRVVDLPSWVSAGIVADVARAALTSFLSGVGLAEGEGRWTKRDVAEWLAGPYSALTSYAGSVDDSSTFKRIAAPVVAQKLEDVLRAAKEEVLATLIMAAPPDNNVQFSHRAIQEGHVVRTRDRQGRSGWAPVDLPGMLLADRVLSMVVVDYLMRPADYLALLSVCGVCQAVSFDAQTRVRGRCLAHGAGLRGSVRKLPIPR